MNTSPARSSAVEQTLHWATSILVLAAAGPNALMASDQVPTMRLLPACLLLAIAPALAQTNSPPSSRGALLYETHCVECHSRQMHWREQRRAYDWDSLRAQVRRWQGVAQLQWTEEDIDEVTRHLNDTIYHFPPATRTSECTRDPASPQPG